MLADVSFEQELTDFIRGRRLKFYDNRRSERRLDFVISFGAVLFHLEAKEKRQAINTQAWPTMQGVKEQDLFILDDLSARKILRKAPFSGLVVRDNLLNRYIFYDVVTLMLAPRLRVNRALNREDTILKGKWILDQRNGIVCLNLDEVFHYIDLYLQSQDQIFEEEAACYGDFYGEYIGIGGRERTVEDHRADYHATR